MSRYIDAEYVKAVMLNDRLMQGNAEFTLYVQQVETQVKALPGIDIVRCRECKHGEYRKDFDDYICDQLGLGFVADADFFCGYGEREGE